MVALALINLLLAFGSGAAVMTALQLFSSTNNGTLATRLWEQFPLEYQIACCALGGVGLAQLLLGVLSLAALVNQSLLLRRALHFGSASGQAALLLTELGLATWLVLRIHNALNTARPSSKDLRVFLEQVNMRHPAGAGAAAAAVLGVLLQTAACCGAVWAGLGAHRDLHLRRRYSNTVMSTTTVPKCIL